MVHAPSDTLQACKLGASKHAHSGACTKWMQHAKEAVAGSMARRKSAQKSEGKPSRMTLRWLEAESGNASEDSLKMKYIREKKTLHDPGIGV